MYWKIPKIIIIWLLSSFFLLACSKGSTDTPEKYKPVKNPNPKYFLTLTGKVVGKGKGTFSFVVNYQTWNEKCYKIVNKFEGIDSPRQRLIKYNIDLSQSNIDIKIPLQYFQPGFCQWKFSGIIYTIRNNFIQMMFGIGDISGVNNQENLVKNKIEFKRLNGKWVMESKSIPYLHANNNYHFDLFLYQ